MIEKIIAIDWAHTKPLTYYIDDENKGELKFENLVDFLTKNNITKVVGENLPTRLLLILLELNISIFRCSGSKTSEFRNQYNIEKSDSNDPKTIFLLYHSQPEVFYQYTEKDKLFIRAKAFYKLRDSMLKTRVAFGNKINTYHKYNIFDHDILERLENFHKTLIKEQTYIDYQLGENEYFKKYIKLFEDIKGIGPVTVAEVVSEIGNINRFSSQSNFLSYCFGYNGTQHCNHNLKIRFLQCVNSVFKAKNEEYLNLYHTYKDQLKLKHPEKIKLNGKTKYNPSHLTALANRRVAREIAKLFYQRLKAYEPQNEGIPMLKEAKIRPIEYDEDMFV